MHLLPGQWWQRVSAVALAIIAAVLYLNRAVVPGFVLWITGILLFLFVLLSFPPLYRKWMAFAEWLSVWVTRALFTIIYFMLVPVIFILYLTIGRRPTPPAGGTASLWIPKRKHDRTVDDLERMG